MTQSLKTTNGKKIILNRAYKASPDYTALSKFKVGYTTSTLTVASNDLTNPLPIQTTESVDDCDATTGWSAGTDSAVALNNSSYKQGTGSLSIAKSGTAGTVCSISKTTTSRDFTSKNLHCWIYITALSDLVASGTAISIRFGSDNSNYYQFDIAIGSLSAGWNFIKKASTDASSTTGTPAIAACDYFAILFNTDLAADTIAANRLLLDDIYVASSDDYLKDFDATYPTLNETVMEAQIRCTLTSTQCNGHSVDSIGLFNADASRLMGSVDVMTAETKDSTDEFIFVIRERIL